MEVGKDFEYHLGAVAFIICCVFGADALHQASKPYIRQIATSPNIRYVDTLNSNLVQSNLIDGADNIYHLISELSSIESNVDFHGIKWENLRLEDETSQQLVNTLNLLDTIEKGKIYNLLKTYKDILQLIAKWDSQMGYEKLGDYVNFLNSMKEALREIELNRMSLEG